ncbi:MAG: SLC13 family permease [Chloroflexota bacterium]|nr:SLC13 family permease [Chloroflexota bacterium]
MQQIAFFVILVVAFGLLLTEWLRNDIVAILIVLSLAVTRVLDPKEALAGFASEPAIVVAAIFVLSGAIQQTGLSDILGRWIGRAAGDSFGRATAVIMGGVAVLSAFTHHLTTTAVMLPVTIKLCRERDIAPSKLLMPLSFAASLGTTITIIGAPAFLIASAVLQQNGRPGLGIFSIAPIGLALSLAGTLFVVLFGRFLLPDRRGGEDAAERFNLEGYLTEITVLKSSPFVGQTVAEVQEDERYHVDVVGCVREGQPVACSPKQRLHEGDVLLVRTTPDQIATIRQESGVELHPVQQYEVEANGKNGHGNGVGAGEDATERLVQAVVGPDADLIGRTIREVDFRRRYGAIVVALWRRDGWLTEELAGVRLREGDVLVIHGDDEALARVRDDRGILMMVPFQGQAQPRRKAPLAGAIMVATVLAAAFNVLSIEMAALAGAVAMILSGCLTASQAYRSIEARIFVFIAGAIPLGAAMTKTGSSDLIAGWLQGYIGGWNEVLVLLALFAVVGILTQFMSDAATTAVFAPIAAALAAALGRPPEPYVVTVAMAAVASFLTPIGHHGNLLVYGPGRYRFADFVKVGTPLTVIVALIVAFLAPILWRA